MSAKQTIDAEILAAFQALDAVAPEDHLDAFEARLLARLEEDDMSEIANETRASAKDRVAAAMDSAEEPSDGSAEAELHDIRALASSTKLRISQRMAAQADPDEELISSPSLALRTISLPEPGKDHPVFATGEKPAAAAAAHEDDAGLPAWIYAAISAVAAAAIVFFILRGQKSDEPIQTASNQASTALQADNLAPTGQGLAGPGALPEGPGGSDGTDGVGTGAGSADMADTAEGAGSAGATLVEGSSSSAVQSNRSATGTRSGDTTAKIARRAGAGDADQKPGEGAASTTAPAETSADKTRKPEKKSDALDDLLTEASGGAAGGAAGTGATGVAQEASPAASKPTRTRLDSGDIKNAMTPIGPKAQACYEQAQLTGMVTVKIEFRIEPSGAISSASAKGAFKGTPTGECVARAVKTATLPPYDGAPMTFEYPFLLTQ